MKNKFIKTKFVDYINEYVNNDILYLKSYLSMTEEQKKADLPFQYSYKIDDFLEEIDFDEFPENHEEYQSFELVDWLYKNKKNIFDEFGDYLYDKVQYHSLNISDEEYPAWSYFDNHPNIVKNQWLIHFTDDAYGISSKGFQYGTYDMSKLGLTTQLSQSEKKYGGYNFAFTIYEYDRYCHSRYGQGFKYGEEAVLFRSSGIETYHYGDEEPQVIFFGKTAKNIVAIEEGYDTRWAVKDVTTEREIFKSDDLKKVVYWIIENYNQYKNKISKR